MTIYTEDEIAEAVDAYGEFHAETLWTHRLCVVVDRNYEGDSDRVIGFRLSIDSDDRSHGHDETFGEW